VCKYLRTEKFFADFLIFGFFPVSVHKFLHALSLINPLSLFYKIFLFFQSIPNAYPSRKPPISILLEKLNLIKSPQNGLELFGRYLLPKFTTIGYEVIKFQNKYFFE